MTDEELALRDIAYLKKTQTRCGRTVCNRTDLTHYNQSTRLLYCSACSRKINDYNPGLCVEIRDRDERGCFIFD